VGRSLSRRQLRPGKKGGAAVGKTKRGKGTKWMVLVDGEGLPLGVRLETASPSEVTLAETTLAQVRVPRPKGRPRQKPERVIADRGYDSDPLRQRLRRRGIELIVPYRENNQHRRYKDRRKLRRYKRRWKVERTTAWPGQFRRLLVRHEYLLTTIVAFSYLACFWITLRRCFRNTLHAKIIDDLWYQTTIWPRSDVPLLGRHQAFPFSWRMSLQPTNKVHVERLMPGGKKKQYAKCS